MNPVELFISHASEDKDTFVRPLANGLIQHPGFKVFYDEYSLVMGDSLLASVSKGLHKCDFGIVVFSPDFLHKKWPQVELDGLFARETIERKIILPVWHNLGREEILAQYPSFADRIASKSIHGVERVVSDILKAVQASQRTKEVNTPLLNKIDSLADLAAITAHLDQLRNTPNGVNLVLEEVERLFNLFESYFAPYKSKLEVVRHAGAARTFVLARCKRVTLPNPQSRTEKRRLAFICDYFAPLRSGLEGATLKLCLHNAAYSIYEITDIKAENIIQVWRMTPVFTSTEGVVWTMFGGGGMRDMSSEALLDHTLTVFVSAIERSILYDHPA